MPLITGTVARDPVVREKVIYSSIMDGDRKLQLVLFRKKRPAVLSEKMINLNVGDEITVHGALEKNPQTEETQLIINGIVDEHDDEDDGWTYNAAHSERWREGDRKMSRQTYDPKLDTWIPDYF